MSEKKRDATIECLRLCMMFCIVLLHVITQDGGSHVWDGNFLSRHFINILSPSVVCFVFISGYFGIKPTILKAVRLLLLAVFYAVILGCMFGLDKVIGRLIHDWFLYSYLVLMLFSPLINIATENLDWRQNVGVLFAVYIWSYLCVIPVVKEFVPCPTGFTPLSFFTMFGIYTAARLYKKYDAESFITHNKTFALLIGMFAFLLVFLGFHHHNSPASLILVCIAFAFVRKIRLFNAARRIVLFVAPSVFGIYLVHSSPLGHFIRKKLLFQFVGDKPSFLSCLLVAFIIYFASICIDVIRRVFVTVLASRLRSLKSQ